MAIMAVCMPASMIDIDTPMRLPVPYTQDCECSCGNCGRMGGVWLNYYSPCRCGSTTIVLAEPFPLPPLREDPPDTQLHPILHPSVYSPSLNPLFTFDLRGNLIHPHRDHLLDRHILDSALLLSFDADVFKIGGERFSHIGHFAPPTVVPEPGTLALLAVGAVVIVRRRRRSAA